VSRFALVALAGVLVDVVDQLGHLVDVVLGVDEVVHAAQEVLAAEAIRPKRQRKNVWSNSKASPFSMLGKPANRKTGKPGRVNTELR
jgi:type III secretory pathway component EscU